MTFEEAKQTVQWRYFVDWLEEQPFNLGDDAEDVMPTFLVFAAGWAANNTFRDDNGMD